MRKRVFYDQISPSEPRAPEGGGLIYKKDPQTG